MVSSLADSSVIIDTKINNRGIVQGVRQAAREISQITDSFKETNSYIKEQKKIIAELERKLKELPKTADDWTERAQGFDKAFLESQHTLKELVKMGFRFSESLEKAELKLELEQGLKSLDDLYEKSGKLEVSLERVSKAATLDFYGQAQQAQSDIESFEQALQRLKSQLATEQDPAMIKALKYEIEATDKAYKDFKQNISAPIADIMRSQNGETIGFFNRLRDTIRNIASAAKSTASKTVNALSTIARPIGKLMSGFMRINRGLLSAAKGALSLGKNGGKAATKIDFLGRKIMRLASTAFVFSVLRRGLMSLSKDLRKTLMANQEFASSWNAIKVNMATAMAPVLDVVIPILVKLMNVLAQVTAGFAQFMATIFGTSVTQARQSAKAYDQQAKGIGGVGSAANDAKKEIASFDQINQQAADNAGGGGSGGGGAGGTNFDIPVPENIGWIDELTEKLKTVFKISDPEYWHGLGRSISDGAANALNKIQWDRIKSGADIFAGNLASFLNGALVNDNLWIAVGHTLGEGVNTALTFANTLGKKFDFSGLGDSIARGANELFETTDFRLLGNTIGTWIKGAYDTATSFTSTFDWGHLVRGAVDAVEGYVDSIDWKDAGKRFSDSLKNIFKKTGEAIQETNWVEFGHKLFNAIWDFISNIDYAGIVEELFFLLGTALIACVQFIYGFVKDAVKAIGEYFMSQFSDWEGMSWWEIGWDIIQGIFTGITKAIGNAAIWIWENIFVPIWNGLKRAFGIASPAETMIEIGDWIIQGLFNGILAGVGFIVDLAKDIWEGIKGAFEAVGEWFGETFSNAKEAVINAWSNTKEFFGNVWSGIKDTFSATKEWFDDTFNGAREFVQNAWESSKIRGFFSDRWDDIKEAYSPAIGWFRDTFNSARESLQEGYDANGVAGFFSSAWSLITDAFSGAAGWFKEMGGNLMSGMREGIDNAKNAVVDTAKNVGNTIVSGLKGIFKISSPSRVMSEMGNNLASSLTDAMKPMTVDVDKLFAQARDNIQRAWQGIGNWFNTTVATPVRNNFDSMLRQVQDSFRNALKNVQTTWGVARGWFETSVIIPIRNAYEALSKDIVKHFSDAWNSTQDIWRSVPGWFTSNVTNQLTSNFSTIYSAILNSTNTWSDSMISAFKNMYNSIAGHSQSWANNLLTGTHTLVSRQIALLNATITEGPKIPVPSYPGSINIPRLARGGIVDSATIAMIGEKGAEAVVPLENNTGWMKPLLDLKDEMQEIKNLLHIISKRSGIFNVNGRELARETFDDFEYEGNRRGFRIDGKGMA